MPMVTLWAIVAHTDTVKQVKGGHDRSVSSVPAVLLLAGPCNDRRAEGGFDPKPLEGGDQLERGGGT